MAYLSLPLSPDQRSSSPVGVSAGSSFPQPPSSSSDLAQCAGTEPKHPVTGHMCTFTNKSKTESDLGFRKMAHVFPVIHSYYLLERS